jgi:hypothetical protein
MLVTLALGAYIVLLVAIPAHRFALTKHTKLML